MIPQSQIVYYIHGSAPLPTGSIQNLSSLEENLKDWDSSLAFNPLKHDH